jgi:hypothetical protein
MWLLRSQHDCISNEKLVWHCEVYLAVDTHPDRYNRFDSRFDNINIQRHHSLSWR